MESKVNQGTPVVILFSSICRFKSKNYGWYLSYVNLC